MTAIRDRKTRLTFETDREVYERGKRRAIVVEPGPWTCGLRLKGTRTRYDVSWETVFQVAARIAADKLREERKTRRKRLTNPSL